MWYLYILECKNKSLYVGVTQDLGRRFNEHCQGKGGHYTKYATPQNIVYKEEFSNAVEAEQRERQVKRWSRKKKLALIQSDFKTLHELSVSRD